MSEEHGYKVGDWVSIKAEVIEVAPNVLVLERDYYSGRTGRSEGTMKFNVVPSMVDRKVPPPLPEEPCRRAILKDKDGKLWTHQVSSKSPAATGWRPLAGGWATYTWGPEFYRDQGPFEVFEPKERI